MNNNTKNSKDNIPEKVLELIPWYAIGKLSIDDQTYFEKALAVYPSLQNYLNQEQQMLELVSADHSILNKSAIASTDERLKSVLNMIDLDDSQKNNTEVAQKNSFLDNLKSVLDALIPNNNGVTQYARIASVSALVISVAVLSAFVAPLFTDKSTYIPASAITKSAENRSESQFKGTVLLVGFNGTSIALGDNVVLQGKLLKIESVPEKEGMFQISFKQKMNAVEIKQTIDTLLSQKELIWFAGEAF